MGLMKLWWLQQVPTCGCSKNIQVVWSGLEARLRGRVLPAQRAPGDRSPIVVVRSRQYSVASQAKMVSIAMQPHVAPGGI